ncbi:GGDEF domain-containing protein [Paraburkholderia dinghuensis]|uniref:diguanylate cyclase n=1 Tax=Paraburkholderia dinghuensis TaxID=2305225 RepID=A0A3N6P5D6_9BURK|nr:GGDEF domain-containing protein [Paraburkholderia dinghuensis]RQH08993.1 GGDEF domain-containing protein [Paraburkholderia dinghuensis]
MVRLADLIPGELEYNEYNWLVSPYRHLGFLTRRRASTIVNRVRLLAFLFAVLTAMWSGVDLIVFPFNLWFNLALIRLVASAAFASLLLYSPNDGNLFGAYRAMAQLFAIPTIFFVASYLLLGHYRLTGLSAAISVGYAFLPFVLLAGLSIFPLTLVETMCFSAPILIAQIIAAVFRWTGMDWPSMAGEFWLLVLISGVSVLAGMSQLGFMIGLVRQAVRDALTGVFSRSGGEEVLELQFSIASRSGAKLAVAFLDLDHFKSINDQYGHEAGDTVLVNMARIVSRHLRRSDVLVRWGGEEFLVIMPDTSVMHAQAALVRLLKAGFGVTPRNTPVTASIGVAELTVDKASDWKSLLEIADQRMYRAKQNGRAQICGYDEKERVEQAELAMQ